MRTAISLVAYVILCVFLGILAFKLMRIDLGAIVLVTLLMAGYDLFLHRDANSRS